MSLFNLLLHPLWTTLSAQEEGEGSKAGLRLRVSQFIRALLTPDAQVFQFTLTQIISQRDKKQDWAAGKSGADDARHSKSNSDDTVEACDAEKGRLHEKKRKEVNQTEEQ